MTKPTKAQRIKSAKQGAKTKRYQAMLRKAIVYQAMIDNGTSIAQIANATNQHVDDVLDALKLLVLVPHPIAQEIGASAHGISIGKDIISSLGLTPNTPPKIIKQHQNAIKDLSPLIQKVMSHPESVRPAIIQTLNDIGQAVTEPINNAGKFVTELITGQKQ